MAKTKLVTGLFKNRVARFPNLVAAETFFPPLDRKQCSDQGHLTRPVACCPEVVFVQNHAVVLEAQAARQFRVGRYLFLIYLAIGQKLRNLFTQLVSPFDITLVELEVHLQRLIGDAFQVTKIKLLRLV